MNIAIDVKNYFQTDHLHDDLKGRSVRGGAVTIIAQATKLSLQLTSTAILARLLFPADFGLIAMVSSVVGFIHMFKDAGLSIATVQRAEINHAQVSTLFWLNFALSSVLMLLTVAVAPAVARFYGEPRLTGITFAFAATFIFAGLTVQHQALLRRQMRFIALSGIEIASQAIGIITAIILSLLGVGYWALVAMHIAIAVTNAVLVWVLCDWRPVLPQLGVGVDSMLSFGGQLTASRVLDYVTRNTDNFLIGAVCGAGPLGFYTRAYQLLLLPIQQINAPLTQVALPALSRLQNDPDRFCRYYYKAIALMVSCGMPIVVFAFVAAEKLILLVLGNQWGESVPIFQALAPAAFIGTLNVATGWVLIPLGRTDKQLWASLFGAILAVLAFLVGVKWGALGVAIAFSISEFIKRPPQILYAFHGTPLKIADLGTAIWKPALISITAGGLMACVKVGSYLANPFASLLADGFVFTAFYLTLWLAVPGGRDFMAETLRLFQRITGQHITNAK